MYFLWFTQRFTVIVWKDDACFVLWEKMHFCQSWNLNNLKYYTNYWRLDINGTWLLRLFWSHSSSVEYGGYSLLTWIFNIQYLQRNWRFPCKHEMQILQTNSMMSFQIIDGYQLFSQNFQFSTFWYFWRQKGKGLSAQAVGRAQTCCL